MDLQQMRYAIAVAEERSFTRAAARCFVVQSALSHRIKALEQELGAALFSRSSRRVEVTQAGEAFLLQARAALDAAQRARDEVAAATGAIRGPLALGIIPTVTAVDLPSLLSGFAREHPEVRLSVRVGDSLDISRRIVAGDLDVGLLGLSLGLAPPQVASRELGTQPLVAVLPAGHALAGRSAISLHDLADEDFLDFPAGSRGREQSDSAFAALGIERRVVAELPTPQLLCALTADRLGVCLLSPGMVAGAREVVAVGLTDGPVQVQHVAWSSFNPRPAARAFVEAVRGAARAEAPAP